MNRIQEQASYVIDEWIRKGVLTPDEVDQKVIDAAMEEVYSHADQDEDNFARL